MKIENALKEYGLKENHVKVYMSCLEIGSGSIQTISQKAKIPRSSCGVILESLKEKGLVSSYIKKTIKQYSIEDPKKIISQIKDTAKVFEEAVPEFSAFYGKNKVLPKVRLYEGISGMKLVMNEILADKEDVSVFTSIEDNFLILGENMENYIKKRTALGIRTRIISAGSIKAIDEQNKDNNHLREVRIIPDSFKHTALIWVWGHKVSMFSIKDSLNALVIENAEIADGQRSVFEMVWASLEPKQI